MGLLQLYYVRRVSEPAFLSLFALLRSALTGQFLESQYYSLYIFPPQKITQTESFLMFLIKHILYYTNCFSCAAYVF